MRSNCFIAALALLVGAHLAPAQQAPDRRITESGKTVTVYSISWPTPISNVVADVEVCAGDNAPQGTFAFPSWFQLHFDDGTAVGSAGTAKQPNLEMTALKAKQCARGWVQFAVVVGQKPVAIHYHELSKDKKPIAWPVKQTR
ncbi:MAG TPA: hypothetical protein VGR59_11600 [Gemmatimonadaceae bacterium]|nr:hypothetical protein [Gemmatimonadaceae bacterium]